MMAALVRSILTTHNYR